MSGESGETPPKSEWKTYAVPVTDRTYGWLRVRAPSPEAAADRAARYVDDQEDHYEDLDFGDRGNGDVAVDLARDDQGFWIETPNETEAEAAIEWVLGEDA